MIHQNISGGAALAAVEKRKKNDKFKNLFILISNTYVGKKELNGIRKDRENIIKAFGWDESDYKELFSQKYINAEFNKNTKSSVKKLVKTTNLASLTRVSKATELLRFCLLTNCTRAELIQNINRIKQKYDYSNIILCITGHGRNTTGFISFLTEDKEIKLSEIVRLLNTEKLLNMTILLDTCRSGGYVDEKAAHELLSNSISKRVVVMTAGWRGQSASDTQNGGYLIQALVKTINENYDLFVLSLLSFKYTLKLVTDIVSDYLYIRLNNIEGMDVREWIRIVNSKDTKYLKQKIEICRKLTSVYLNSRAREYLERLPERLDEFERILLPLLCRNYKDIYLSVAAVGTKPTKIKVKR